MYADTITGSMQRTINETNRRREKQQEYNKLNNITPKQIFKTERNVLGKERAVEYNKDDARAAILEEPSYKNMNKKELEKAISNAKSQMEKSAAELDFASAIKYRDTMNTLKDLFNKAK